MFKLVLDYLPVTLLILSLFLIVFTHLLFFEPSFSSIEVAHLQICNLGGDLGGDQGPLGLHLLDQVLGMLCGWQWMTDGV